MSVTIRQAVTFHRMPRLSLTAADLPVQALVFLHDQTASLVLTWQSDHGRHIICTDIPIAWCQEVGHEEEVLRAVRSLEQALLLEAESA